MPFTPSPSTTGTLPASTQPSPTPSALPPDFWQSLPVIPAAISDRVREVYRLGLEMGNNPHVFSRIGDCASAAPAFLTGFDRDYDLGEYGYLQPAIDYFSGSFERPSVAAKGGLTSSGLLTTLWTDELCENNETLLACQYRLDGPGFAIISIGTNEAYYIHNNPASFEINLRLIIEETIARGIVPILGTKADNFEGDNSINATIARLAMEYELPLWNFWLAAQPLPNQGLLDPSHLSTISYINFTDFSIPHSLEYGVQMRNLTALQMLHFLWGQLVIPDPVLTPTP
ncbi:MAG: hypothetical protein HY781_08000 [Chloroflexi bacterium]|nr:hypothetical protein [Chloroflexota bacterium]